MLKFLKDSENWKILILHEQLKNSKYGVLYNRKIFSFKKEKLNSLKSTTE